MTEFISKTGAIKRNSEEIYTYLSDFRNLDDIVPQDKVKNWESTEDECRFAIEGVGKAGMKIIEKEPYKLIKLTSLKESPISFNLWLQLKEVGQEDTRIRIVVRAKLSPFIKAAVSKHLEKGLDAIIDKLTEFFNARSDL
jgi:carbon monoxide dehydrogenase subunit G